MAPVRRYLRITKYSVLEVRVYLEDPYQQSWLLNPRLDVLPRIITAIRPHVFRQLWDDKDRAKGKSKKKKGVKDVAYGEDFEVSIFLTDPSTRHSLLVKQKDFGLREKRIKSNSGKLTGWLTGSDEKPIDVDAEDENDEGPVQIREESDDEGGSGLARFAPIAEDGSKGGRGKRRRGEDDQGLFMNEEDVSGDEGFQTVEDPGIKRTRGDADAGTSADDKKKLNMNLTYDGFSIYGRILCLVVKRRGAKGGSDCAASPEPGGKQMLESWVSTQAAQDQVIADD